MESVMAPTSQRLLQGGMRTRDWFSDKLEGGREGGRSRTGEAEGNVNADGNVGDDVFCGESRKNELSM